MTREERNKKILALKRRQRRAASEMMKIYRRRRRVLRAVLCLIKYTCLLVAAESFLMFAITIDPIYTGNLNCYWFILAILVMLPIFTLADKLDAMLKRVKR